MIGKKSLKEIETYFRCAKRTPHLIENMARIFLAISILLTLVSGVLSIQTRGKAKGIRDDLTSAKTTATVAADDAKKAKEAAKAAEEKATDALAKKEQVETQLTAAKGEAEKATKDLADVKTQLDAKDKSLATLTEERDKLKNVPAAPTVNPETEQKLKDAQAALAEKDTVTKALEDKLKQAETDKKVFAEEKARREQHQMKPGLEGRVLAVNPSWNFVVLSMGDHQGVVPTATLLVKRGGFLVAKVRVTSVEPSTSIADILPSGGGGSSIVQPGDVVIYSRDEVEGSTAQGS